MGSGKQKFAEEKQQNRWGSTVILGAHRKKKKYR